MAQTALPPSNAYNWGDKAHRLNSETAKKANAARQRYKNGNSHPVWGPQWRAGRRALVLDLKLRNHSAAEIAAKLNISVSTVQNDMRRIRQDGLIEKHESKVLSQLMPEALRVLNKRMVEDDDVKAASKVVDLFVKLGDRKAEAERNQPPTEEESLESWFAQWQQQQPQPAAEEPPVIDITPIDPVNHPPALSPPADPNSEPPAGQRSPEASGADGSGSFSGTRSKTPETPIGPNASETGRETHPTVETALALFHTLGGGAGEAGTGISEAWGSD